MSSESTYLTGSARFIVDYLKNENVSCVFGIPATHVVEIYEALRTERSIRSIVGRNEQATCYMADGYARRSRELGVTVVTGGPGLGNSISGLQCSYADSAPVLLITSDLNPDVRSRQPMGIPHETFNSETLAHSTGAHTVRIDSQYELKAKLMFIVESMMEGRRRPGVCLISREVLENRESLATSTTERIEPTKQEVRALLNTDILISQVVELLSKSRKPLILAGMGIYWSRSEDTLSQLLNRLQIPCLTTVPATGVIPQFNKELIGNVSLGGNRKLLEEADLIIGIGCGFGSVTTLNGSIKVTGKLIHVNIDPHEIGQIYEPDIGVLMDAGDFMNALLKKVNLLEVAQSVWTPLLSKSIENPWVTAIEIATQNIPTTIVGDVCITTDWMYKNLTITRDRKLFMPWNYMNLGWSYAAALGMKAAAPEDFVISVMGDGGVLFSLGEIATAVENQLPVCLVVFNNSSYGTIELVQKNWFKGNTYGVHLENPQFSLIAESFGIPFIKCKTPSQLTDALIVFSQLKTSSFIEVEIELISQDQITNLYAQVN